MKKWILFTTLFTTLFVSAFAKSKVDNFLDLTEEEINEIIQGERPDRIVEFTAGTKIPIYLFLTGDLLNFVDNEGKIGAIAVKQTVFAKCDGDLLLSHDLKKWKSLPEFITGEFSMGLTVQDEIPSLVISGRADRRS